jgi:DNA-binding CsgD family transcriptional regulator
MNESAARSTGKGEGGAKRARTGPLSNREREIVELLADGLSGAEIAERLVLSPETVRTHIRNAMSKLGASTRSQAVAVALRRREIAQQDEPEASPRDTGAAGSANGGPTLSPRELAAPLEAAVDGLLSLWDVDAGWIFLAEDDGLTLRRVAERTSGEGLPATLALGEGALGSAALERRAQILRGTGSKGGAMIVAPMLDGNRLIGVIGLAARPSRATGRQELLLLQAFAGRLAEVIQAGGARLGAGVDEALRGFRASWASASRPI